MRPCVLSDGSERLLRDELSAGFDGLGAHYLPLPLDGRFGSCENLDNGVCNVGADAIARN